MRITDWSSDVCYSDLGLGDGGVTLALAAHDPDLPLFAVNVQAHGTGRTDDHATGGINVVSVEILHLLLGDPAHLIHRHRTDLVTRSEEHTSELQSLMRISYAVFCLKQKHPRHLYETIQPCILTSTTKS